MIYNHEIVRGTVLTVFFSVMMGSFALGNAGPQVSTIATAKGSAGPVLDVIDREPEIDASSAEGLKLDEPKGRLELKDVVFSYPTRKQITVLDGISFTVEPGQTVALVGSSGCGKSTVVNLILRYYDVDSGKLMVDGERVNELNLHWLRQQIGVVSQEPILFETTIEENIRLGCDGLSYQDVIRASKKANAHNFITHLSKGYQTIAGERGAQLSGGQKQRVAIARALVRNPKILLLDEATSALDAESEGIVQEALDKAREGRTTIVVAHRLSTIRNADKILTFDQGRIVEEGTHAELMEKKGLYHQLVTSQIFEDGMSDYASATDGALEVATKDSEDGQSMLSVDSKGRPRKRSKKRASLSRSKSVLSDVSSEITVPDVSPRPSLIRLPSKIQTEAERLKKEVEEEGVEKSTLLQIMEANKPEWRWNLVALFGCILRGSAMPAFAYFYGEMFNSYSMQGEEMLRNARFWALMFLVIGISQGIAMFISSYCFGVSGEHLTKRLRLQVFQNILRQDVAYFDNPKHSTGKICTRLATDAPNIKAAVDFRFGTVLASVITMVAGIIMALIFGWKMALLTFGMIPIVSMGGYFHIKVRTGNQKRDAELLEEAGKTASEAIENIRTVQALGREEYFYEEFCKHMEIPRKHGMKHAWVHAVCFAFAQSIFFFFYAAVFRWGGFLIQIGDMTPITVYRVFFAITFCGMSIGWASAYFPEFIKARFSAALIFKMIKQEPKIDNFSTTGLKPDVRGDIAFEDVYFNYPNRFEIQVLKGLQLALKPGKTLALVGQSGCGKSTVVSLLQRFYDPLDGVIKVDDTDIRVLNVVHHRSHIAPVSQEPVLFDCSIRDNIVYGLDQPPSDQEVQDAAKLANIHEFIVSLPQGYSTRVGEKGTQLSGGQKQRVAIARALVREPKILLLDEATSALDTESEKIVQEALDRARQGRTCIIVAHRLSTVQTADSIAVIKDGKVVEQGSHSELVALKGAYYNLTKKQNLQ